MQLYLFIIIYLYLPKESEIEAMWCLNYNVKNWSVNGFELELLDWEDKYCH